MTQARVWIVCRPNARANANAALAAVNALWANTLRVSQPRAGAAKIFVCGWQDTVANLQTVRTALQGVAGVRMFLGAVWGEESEESAQADATQGSAATTKYRRRAAIRAAVTAMGLNVPDAELD